MGIAYIQFFEIGFEVTREKSVDGQRAQRWMKIAGAPTETSNEIAPGVKSFLQGLDSRTKNITRSGRENTSSDD